MQAEESLAKETRLRVAACTLSGLGTVGTVLRAILSSSVRSLREWFPCMYADPPSHLCRLFSAILPQAEWIFQQSWPPPVRSRLAIPREAATTSHFATTFHLRDTSPLLCPPSNLPTFAAPAVWTPSSHRVPPPLRPLHFLDQHWSFTRIAQGTKITSVLWSLGFLVRFMILHTEFLPTMSGLPVRSFVRLSCGFFPWQLVAQTGLGHPRL